MQEEHLEGRRSGGPVQTIVCVHLLLLHRGRRRKNERTHSRTSFLCIIWSKSIILMQLQIEGEKIGKISFLIHEISATGECRISNSVLCTLYAGKES